jgi:hypothetical protein
MYFSAAPSSERPRQHEFRFENRSGGLNHAVQGGRQVADHWVLDPPLDLGHHLAGIALEPTPIEGLGH